MILLIDNYDSFSYNLYQMLGEIVSECDGKKEGKNLDAKERKEREKRKERKERKEIQVIRNDEKSIAEIREMSPERIILSPGPGRPEDAGITMEAALSLGKEIPVLGVCLGHQAICAAFGGQITYAKKLMHGKQSQIRPDRACPIFAHCPEEMLVGRYHSLAADPATLPDCLAVTGEAEDGEIMAVQHREYPIFGVQFHPESILTPEGKRVLEDFCRYQIA